MCLWTETESSINTKTKRTRTKRVIQSGHDSVIWSAVQGRTTSFPGSEQPRSQGLSSKMRDPGNEVGFVLVLFVFVFMDSTPSQSISTQIANIQPFGPHAWSITHIEGVFYKNKAAQNDVSRCCGSELDRGIFRTINIAIIVKIRIVSTNDYLSWSSHFDNLAKFQSSAVSPEAFLSFLITLYKFQITLVFDILFILENLFMRRVIYSSQSQNSTSTVIRNRKTCSQRSLKVERQNKLFSDSSQ